MIIIIIIIIIAQNHAIRTYYVKTKKMRRNKRANVGYMAIETNDQSYNKWM